MFCRVEFPWSDVACSQHPIPIFPSPFIGTNGITFSVRAGEVLGFAGLVGAGRSEMAQAIFGLDPQARGYVLMRDIPVSLVPGAALERGVVRGRPRGRPPVKPFKNVTEGRYRRAIYDVTRDGWPKGRRR